MVKAFRELTFSDDFVFGKVLTGNLDLTKELLELILDKKIREVKLVEPQKTLKETYASKGIRLDVYVEDDANTVYDVEMQTTFAKDLAQRMRYYQSIIDLNILKSGKSYADLRKSYIIFVCLSDPFGENLPKYTFEYVCAEKSDLKLNDLATKKVQKVWRWNI